MKTGTWYKDVGHQIGDGAGSHSYQLFMLQTHYVSPPVLLRGWCCRPCAVGLVDLGRRVYLRWRSGVLSKTSSHMWGSWYLPIFLLRNGSLTLMNTYTGTPTTACLLSTMCNTPTHRSKTVCANPQLQHKEEENIKKAQTRGKYLM